jgi:hypothetical protein
MERSMERITEPDLQRLAAIARIDRESMFRQNEHWRAYQAHLLCVALCQGAGLHYVTGTNGVKDFDVWTFFAKSAWRKHPDPALYRRNRPADFGESRFGRTISAPSWIKGRRIDLLARSLDVAPSADPIAALLDWLTAGRTTSARRLAQKAVVMVEPICGTVVWPPAG